MQSKVSIVITCYNKEKYIGGMLDSILTQEWDNIEIILVNDGSTDGTRNIIAEYEPRFTARGFEIIIIDQDNQGVSAAARNGLMRVTGEFVCLLDADDALDHKYVSTMAGWLDENPDYDWTACDSINIRDNLSTYIQTMSYDGNATDIVDRWILRNEGRAIWCHMVRTEYLRHCNVVELFYTGRDGNQEAQFFIPLAFGGGKIKVFHEPLYIYKYSDQTPSSHRSHVESYAKLKERNDGFITSFVEISQRLPISEKEKKRICATSEIEHNSLTVRYTFYKDYASDKLIDSLDILLKKVSFYYTPANAFNKRLAYVHPLMFCAALKANILRTVPEVFKFNAERIIAWGVLGKNAGKVLPFLIGTPLEPTEFWDSAAKGGIVRKPDVSSLTERDVVIILPSLQKVGAEIKSSIGERCCRIITFEQIFNYVSALKFPQFYDGTIKFEP
jgi:glycosyltransferase involved in cell wall biosynthesis